MPLGRCSSVHPSSCFYVLVALWVKASLYYWTLDWSYPSYFILCSRRSLSCIVCISLYGARIVDDALCLIWMKLSLGVSVGCLEIPDTWSHSCFYSRSVKMSLCQWTYYFGTCDFYPLVWYDMGVTIFYATVKRPISSPIHSSYCVSYPGYIGVRYPMKYFLQG